MKTFRMKLDKVHKVLASYALVDDKGKPVAKPPVSAIYVRQSDYEDGLPEAFEITMKPVGKTKKVATPAKVKPAAKAA